MYTVLQQERIAKQWSQEYVAKKIGITPEAVSMLETGKRKPSYNVLVKLLDLFGCKDPRELFAEVPEPPISSKAYHDGAEPSRKRNEGRYER